jgi:outer membrane protein assembly factor BamB
MDDASGQSASRRTHARHGKIFAGGSDGRAYAFDKRTGGVLWSIPFRSRSAVNPL